MYLNCLLCDVHVLWSIFDIAKLGLLQLLVLLAESWFSNLMSHYSLDLLPKNPILYCSCMLSIDDRMNSYGGHHTSQYTSGYFEIMVFPDNQCFQSLFLCLFSNHGP